MMHYLRKQKYDASVLDITTLSPTVKQIMLKMNEPFHFLPGQWLEVVYHNHATNITEITGFSFVDSHYIKLVEKEQKITLAIKLSEHPIVQYIHHQLQINDILQIQGPDGTFTFPPQDTNLHDKTKVMLIGSGIGVTPLISMIRTFLDYKVKYSKVFPNKFFDQIEHFEFVYGVRNEEEFLFAKELLSTFEQLSSLLPFTKLHVCFSKQHQVNYTPTAFFTPHFSRISSTLLHQLVPSNSNDENSNKYLIYLCGPSTLVTEMKQSISVNANISIQYEKW